MTGFGPAERLAATLAVVFHEGRHLAFSRDRIIPLLTEPGRLGGLDVNPEDAERLEAFVSRFGRMQDTVGEKLLPRWLEYMAERPGPLIDVLNRAERLGVLDKAAGWMTARQLRNRLVHEYVDSIEDLAAALRGAQQSVPMLFDTYNRIRERSLAAGLAFAAGTPPTLPST